MSTERSFPQMPVREALAALAAARDETTIVVTHQGSARVWPLLDEHPLDFHYNPSTMGGATALGLGLALANPGFQVIVVSGDGALAMSLGSLISIAAAGVTNLTVVVLDNGRYEVTGGQATAASRANVDFAAIARGAGFRFATSFDDESSWREQVTAVLGQPGPRLVTLRVAPAIPADMQTVNEPIGAQVDRLAAAISARSAG